MEWSLECLSLEFAGLVVSEQQCTGRLKAVGSPPGTCPPVSFFQASLFSPGGAATSHPTQVKFLACQEKQYGVGVCYYILLCAVCHQAHSSLLMASWSSKMDSVFIRTECC